MMMLNACLASEVFENPSLNSPLLEKIAALDGRRSYFYLSSKCLRFLSIISHSPPLLSLYAKTKTLPTA